MGFTIPSFGSMRWSKIKQCAESFLCAELSGRLALYLTSYDPEHRERGRGWMTLDGEEVYSANGEKARQEFFEAVVAYPNLAVEDALAAEDPLTRILSLADRRVGKRRLRERGQDENSTPLERRILEIR